VPLMIRYLMSSDLEFQIFIEDEHAHDPIECENIDGIDLPFNCFTSTVSAQPSEAQLQSAEAVTSARI